MASEIYAKPPQISLLKEPEEELQVMDWSEFVTIFTTIHVWNQLALAQNHPNAGKALAAGKIYPTPEDRTAIESYPIMACEEVVAASTPVEAWNTNCLITNPAQNELEGLNMISNVHLLASTP